MYREGRQSLIKSNAPTLGFGYFPFSIHLNLLSSYEHVRSKPLRCQTPLHPIQEILWLGVQSHTYNGFNVAPLSGADESS